jgi:hypothetical protein
MIRVGHYAAGLRRVELNPDVCSDVERLSVAGERFKPPEPNRIHRFIL